MNSGLVELLGKMEADNDLAPELLDAGAHWL